MLSRMKQGVKPKKKPKLKKGEIVPFDVDLLYALASEERALLNLHYSAVDRLEKFMAEEIRRILDEVALRIVKHTKIPSKHIKIEVENLPTYGSLQIWKSLDVKARVLTVSVRVKKVKSGRLLFLTKERPKAQAEHPVLEYVVWYDMDEDPFSGRHEFSAIAEVTKWLRRNRVGIRKRHQKLFGVQNDL